MRVDDLAPPAMTPHVLPPGAPMGRWPAQLRVGLERLPQAAYVWDDADPDVVWDAPEGLDAPAGAMAGTTYTSDPTVTGFRLEAFPPECAPFAWVTGSTVWLGRSDATTRAPAPIRWHECWEQHATGPDTLAWRFDVDDYPGGTNYDDPRGRHWVVGGTAPTPIVTPYVWDAPFIGAGFTDAVCDLISLVIDPAEPDDLGLFGATAATLTLANPDGEYTVWSVDGRLVYWAPGRQMCVWATLDGEDYWLFSGRVSAWRQQADGTVVVEAFDGLAALADELGAEWTPGAPGDTVAQRITAVAADAGYTDPLTLDVGNVTLSTEPDTATPLDAIQRAALSDGGVFAGDADGRLIYRNRLWRTGRDDQGPVPAFTDNVCRGPVVVWDLELAADDAGLFTSVDLTNLAGLRAVAGPVTSWYDGPGFRLTHPDPDLWQTQDEGDDLAGYLLAQTSTPALAPRAFVLYLHDPQQDLWRTGLDLRRGDRMEILHDYVAAGGVPAQLDVFSIVGAAGHTITPDEWIVDVFGTRTVDWRAVELWDVTRFTWDDPDPLNVWRF